MFNNGKLPIFSLKTPTFGLPDYRTFGLFPYFCTPDLLNHRDHFMNIFRKQLNADAQENAGAPEAAEVTTATTNAPVAPAPVIETAHDDFDWSIDKRNVSHYAESERVKYDKVYDDTFVQIEDGEIVRGGVVALTKTDVVVNIGFKSDGLVSLNEFRDVQGLKIGDEVEVMVVEKEDRNGNLHLSRNL